MSEPEALSIETDVPRPAPPFATPSIAPAAEIRQPGIVQPLSGKFDLLVRGWRPFGGWVVCGILIVRGIVTPIVQLCRHQPPEQIDLVALSALVGLLGLARWRTKERLAGASA